MLAAGPLPAQASTDCVSMLAGADQSAALGAAFSTALQVTVVDGSGQPASGVSVTFSAPFSGASGTFAGNVSSVTVTSNGSGVATAPTLTADDTAGTFDVTAGVAGATPVQFVMTNDPGAPVQLLFTSAPSLATAGEAFAVTPSVVVEDVYGNAVTTDTAQVSLSLAPGDGPAGVTLSGTTSVAAAGGVASFAGVSIDEAGNGYKLVANDTADGLTATSSALDVAAGAPATVTLAASPSSVSPGGSTTLSGSVTDAYGNPVDGVTVDLTATSGSLAQSQATTDPSGQWGDVALTLPYTAGTDTVTASVYSAVYGTLAKHLSVTVQTGAPYQVTIVGSPATVAAGGTMALSGAVEDAYGNGVSGVPVDLTTTGGTLSRSQVTSGSDGQWSGAALEAPTAPGSLSVSATVYGTITKTLPVTVTVGAPYHLTLSAASTNVTAGGGTTLSVDVTDVEGNGVAGASVDLSTTGGQIATPQVTTDASGRWNYIGFTAPPTTGTVTVTAKVYGTSLSQNLNLTVAAGAPAQTTVSASPSSVTAGGSATLSGRVTDADGNGVGNVTVDLATTAGSLSTSQVVTDGSGRWNNVDLGVPTAAGQVTVTATVAGTPISDNLPVTVAAGTPASITITPAAASVSVGGSTTLSVDVTDSYGNGVGGATVDLAASGATLAQAQVTTGAGGQSTGIGLTMPTSSGTVTVTATVAGTSVSQSATLTATPLPASQVAIQATPSTVSSGGAAQLSGAVTDADGNGVADVTVDLSATSGSLSAAHAVTGSTGQWTGVTLTAPAAEGPVTVTATVHGTTIHQSVSVSVTPGSPAQVSIVASPAGIAAGGSTDLSGSVTDAGGNGVGNVTVDLVTSAGSLSESQVKTASDGRWSGATLTAPGTPGQPSSATVTATVAATGISQTATVPVGPAAPPTPPDGIGTLTVSPSSVVAGATDQSLTFTYTAPDALSAAELEVALPAGWSAAGVVAGSDTASVTGGTVQVAGIALSADTPLTIGLTGVTVGTATGAATFAASEASSAGGTLTALTTSPTVTVTAANPGGQGNGPGGGQNEVYIVKVALTPASVPVGGVAQVTGTVTDGSGPVSGATVALSLSRGDEALDMGTVSGTTVTTDASGAFDAVLTAPSASGAVTLTAQLVSPSTATVTGSVYGAGQTEAQAVEIVTPEGTTVDGAKEAPSSGACGAAVAVSGYTSETGCGTGTFAVAEYSGNPTGVTPSAGAGGYFDAAVSAANQFTSVTIKECNVSGGDSLEWWDPQSGGGAGGWEAVYEPAAYSSGCLSFVADASSSPSLDELFGTVFTVVTSSSVTAGGGGGGGTAPAPTVQEISPAGGAPGTTVTIRGYGFSYATSVNFGANPAERFVVDSDAEITAVAPPGTGTVDVTISNVIETSQSVQADQFTYTAPAAPAAPAPSPQPQGAQGCTPKAFTDVPAHFWAQQAIAVLSCKGIVGGFPDGTFRPNQPVTRAQFVKMLVLAFGLQPGPGTQTFSDVPPGSWFAPYVAAAVSAGIVQGTSPSTFSPGATVTREEMAVLLARALGLTAAMPLSFTDLNRIDPWAVIGVSEAVAAGYLNGFPDGSFQPRGPTTRAQAAKVLAMVVQRRAG